MKIYNKFLPNKMFELAKKGKDTSC